MSERVAKQNRGKGRGGRGAEGWRSPSFLYIYYIFIYNIYIKKHGRRASFLAKPTPPPLKSHPLHPPRIYYIMITLLYNKVFWAPPQYIYVYLYIYIFVKTGLRPNKIYKKIYFNRIGGGEGKSSLRFLFFWLEGGRSKRERGIFLIIYY